MTNLFVVSHGWNNQVADARSLYQRLFPIIQAQAGAEPPLPTIGFVGVIWPAIDFPDDPGTPAGPIGIGAQGADDAPPAPVNVTTQKTGAEITATMAPAFSPAEQRALTKMGDLIDQGLQQAGAGTPDAIQQEQLNQFHALLQGLMGQSDGALEDAGELALTNSSQPVDDYQILATAMSTGMAAGDAQGLGSVFAKAWNGAKDALRVFSFWKMKARAGVVGRAGLGPDPRATPRREPIRPRASDRSQLRRATRSKLLDRHQFPRCQPGRISHPRARSVLPLGVQPREPMGNPGLPPTIRRPGPRTTRSNLHRRGLGRRSLVSESMLPRRRRRPSRRGGQPVGRHGVRRIPGQRTVRRHHPEHRTARPTPSPPGRSTGPTPTGSSPTPANQPSPEPTPTSSRTRSAGSSPKQPDPSPNRTGEVPRHQRMAMNDAEGPHTVCCLFVRRDLATIGLRRSCDLVGRQRKGGRP